MLIIMEGYHNINPQYNILATWIKYSKSLFNLGKMIKIFREIWTRLHVEKKYCERLWSTLDIGYKFLSSINSSPKLLLKIV